MNLTKLKEKIFEVTGFTWNNENPDESAHELQAQGEYILSELLTRGGIPHSESQDLMTTLMDEYGYPYPPVLPGEDDPKL